MARAAHIGLGSESAAWKAAMDLYYDDKVVAALDLIESNAAGYGGSLLSTYRMIEGEARTRAASERISLGNALELEWVPHEVPHHNAVGEVILNAATAITRRLQWDGHESVLATVLVAEADADWHEARYGYCVDKRPYDKICLPHVSCHDPAELWRVTAHEFAHVVVLNTAQKLAPHWLDEGVACLMEGRNALRSAERLGERRAWRTPAQMGGAFDVDRRDPAKFGGIAAAYDQATVLVAYLHSLAGDAGLVALLKAFTDHSRWTDLVTRLASRDPVDVALQQVHDFGQDELFDRAKTWPSPRPA
ncbi:MAG: hypothetical protein ACYC96_05665 [Fimbriimonadaceae bacterium]